MTPDIAMLGIGVDTRDLKKGDKALQDFGKTAGKAEKATDSFADSAKGLRKALAAVATAWSAVDFASKVIDSQRAFDKLNSSLITATGSSKNAAVAFSALQRFAATTPYGLQEVGKAFVQLRNLGLTPSERALKSYGNTAAAMGKSLNQLVEAVADAATGEFERLKEFGIRSKNQGDTIAFTFQGVTTTVKNNAAEIESYLMKLGESNFAGGMELQAKTLDGAISNLADTWDSFLRSVSQAGAGDAALSVTKQLTSALEDMSAIVDVLGKAWAEEGKQAESAGIIHKTITTVFETISVLGLNVAYVLGAIGKDIGALAAAAALAAQGEFKQAGQLWDLRKVEAEEERKRVDERTRQILTAAETTRAARAKEQAEKEAAGRDDLARFKVVAAAQQQQTAAQKKAADEAASFYAKTRADLQERVQLLALEGQQRESLTEGQKFAVKVLGDLVKFSKNLTAEQKKKIAADLEELLTLEKLNKERAEAVRLADQRADLIRKETDDAYASVAALREQVQLYGMSKEQVLELQLARYSAALDQRDLDQEEIDRLEKLYDATEKQLRLQRQLSNLEAGTKFWSDLESTARTTFISLADGGKNAAQRLKDTFKNVFFDWLYKMTLQKWIINIGASLGASGGIFGNAAAAGAGGSAAGAGAAGLLGGIFGAGGLGGALAGGAGWLTGATTLGGSLGAAGSLIGAGGAGILPGLAMGAGALLPIVAGGVLLSKAFGRGPKTTTGQTAVGSFGAGGFSGNLLTDWVKKGGWLRSDKRGTDTSALDANTVASLTAGFTQIKQATTEYAKALQLPTDTINGFTASLKVSLTGDQAQDAQAYAAALASAGDQLATSLLPSLSEFQTEGESATATLQRLAVGFVSVNELLTAMGVNAEQAFGAVGVASLVARERLISLAGGLDKLAEQSAFFAQNFLTEAQRLAPAQKRVAETLAQLGYSSVTTVEQFSKVVTDLAASGALATESGAKLYASLLALAPEFKLVADYAKQIADADLAAKLEETRKAEEAAAEARNRAAQQLKDNVQSAFDAVGRAIDAEKQGRQRAHEAAMANLDAQAKAAQDNIARIGQVASSLRSALQSMGVTGTGSRAQAQAFISRALATSRTGGGLPDAGELQGALSTLSRDSSGMFTSREDFLRDYYRTAIALSDLSETSEEQLSLEERTLRALEETKERAEAQFEAEMQRLDAQLAAAQAQLDALNGVNTSVLSVADALSQFASAVNAAKAGGVGGGGGGGGSSSSGGWTAPPGVFGPGGSPASQPLFWENTAVDWWANVRAGGTGVVPGFASGGMHEGGWRVVGESGPEMEFTGPSRIYSNSASSDLFDTESIVTAVSEMMPWLYRIAKAAENSDKIMTRWETQGLPETRET